MATEKEIVISLPDGETEAWMTLDNPAYDAAQRERGFERLLALFGAELGR